MNMNFDRYNFIYHRLGELYEMLNGKIYRIWIAPEKRMTLDELRSRPVYHQEGFANDTNFYIEKQMRGYKIPRLVDLMPNLTSYKDITFEKPQKNLVEVYEGIQEWISLWCDIMRNAPDMKHPTIKELRDIENLAYLIFPEYRRIKPYLVKQANSKAALEAKLHQDRGLATLTSLFGMNSTMNTGKADGSISWYSHLDALLPENPSYRNEYDPGNLLRVSDNFKNLGIDSLSHMDTGIVQNSNWPFTAG